MNTAFKTVRHPIRSLRNLLLLLGMLTAALATAVAEEPQADITVIADASLPEIFTLRLDKENLIISDMNRKQIAVIPPETISFVVHINAYTFFVTYGRNAGGDLMAVITADPQNPKGLSFSVNSRHIEMDRSTPENPVSLTLILSEPAERAVADNDLATRDATVTPLGQAPAVKNLDISSIGSSNFTPYNPPANLYFRPARSVAVNLNPRATTPF